MVLGARHTSPPRPDAPRLLPATRSALLPLQVDYYGAFVLDPAVQVMGVFNRSGEHAFLTVDQGSECLYKGEPFINACGYDAAGELLQHLYGGTLVAPDRGSETYDVTGLGAGQLLEFDQSKYLETGYTLETASLYPTGFMYVPDQCRGSNATACRVHVAFHGCEMTVPDVGEQFVLTTGYNPWAAANGLVVLYPQVKRTEPLNPKGCWDWWGYTGADYASQLGVQMHAVDAMVTGLAR